MRGTWLILGALACAAPALAQQPQSTAAEARFQVSGYAVEGRVLLKSEDFTRVVSPYVGRGKSAADIERARRALQDTYHNLGHCSVRVTLAQPEPKDGMVTFVVSEAPASEVRDCLPTVVLDEPAKRGPAVSAAATPAAATVYSYADPRDPAGPVLKPRAAAAPPSTLAAAPPSASVVPTASAPASAAPPRRTDSPSGSSAPALTQPAVDAGQPGATTSVAIAPYVEGAGAKGLSVMSDSPKQPAKPLVVAAVEPAKPALPPAAPASPADAKSPVAAPVVAAVEPAKPASLPPAPAALPVEAKAPVAASPVIAVEPAKPAPLLSAPAASPVEAKPSVAAPAVARVEPAQPAAAPVLAEANKPAAPAAVTATEQAEPATPVPAAAPAQPRSSAPVQVAAAPLLVGTAGVVAEPQPASPAPPATAKPASVQPVTAVARAEPAKAAPTASAPAASSAEARPPVAAPAAVVAQAEPARPAPAKPAPAEPAAPAALKFEIARYAVEGNTLLKQQAVDRALAPFTGPGKDFGDVQRALEALQLAYQNEGYGGVEIRLPEQELDKGEVKLRVVEPKIAKITIEGNEHFNDANIRRSVPGLREGETPNSREIGIGVRLANENSAKQSAVLLRASEREDQLDATIRVADVDPKRYSMSLDNTGNDETYRERLGLAFQHSNLFNRDHVMTLQFITAPQNFNDVIVFGLGYRIPIYSLGDSIDFVAGYSNVDSGTVQNLFVVAGKGSVYALRYNQSLQRWGDLEHKLSYGLDYRAYQNDVNPVGGEAKLVPDVTVHPISLTYSGAWRAEGKGEVSYYASLIQNIAGGNDGKGEDFSQVGARFPEGEAWFHMVRSGATYSRPIGEDWQVRIRADGQYTGDALVSTEMFAIGGADSVRGFNERYVSNDRGYRTSWELYTPDMAKAASLDGRLRLLAFYDQGVVRRNKVQPGEVGQQSLDSGGLGLRLNYKTNLTFRFDVAYIFHDGTSNNGKTSQTKAHFALAWVW